MAQDKVLDIQDLVRSSLEDLDIDTNEPEINASVMFEDFKTQNFALYHFNPEEDLYYPASLIKLFHVYLAKVRLQDKLPEILKNRDPSSTSFGRRTIMDEVYDAIHAALKASDNDALSFLMDFNTDTTSGISLDMEDFTAFKMARKRVSDLYQAKGYSKLLNLASKCFSFGPFGRDYQLIFEDEGLGRNMVMIQDVSRIMKDLWLDFPELYEHMRRDLDALLKTSLDDDNDRQIEFIAAGLENKKDQIKEFYSKAGWTPKVRHDTALIKFNNGQEFLLTIMTKGLSKYTDLIPLITSKIFSQF